MTPNLILIKELGHEIADNLREHGPKKGREISREQMKLWVDIYWWQFERAGAQPANIEATLDYIEHNCTL